MRSAAVPLRRLGRPTALADLICPSPLILPNSGARLAQAVVGPGSVRLLTVAEEADPDGTWATHLEGRIEAIASSAAPAEPVGGARIVGGDFNMQAGSTEYNKMATPYGDAWLQAKALGTALNFSGNCDGCTRNSRIDYVFASKAATWCSAISTAR